MFLPECGLERLMLDLWDATNPGAERQGYGGIWVMSAASINRLMHRVCGKRLLRRRRMLTLALSAVLVACICILPARRAFADQVLELPATAAPASSPDASVGGAPEPEPKHRTMAPMPSGLGSIEDYERQGEPSSSAGIAGARPNLHIDPSGNRQALANDVILGALAIGLFALEVHAAHQHRHR